MGTTGILGRIERFFSGWRFPAWILSLLIGYELALLTALALPIGPDALGRFAEEFKTWCFGYDPATGRYETMLVVMMAGEPLGLALLIAALWKKPLQGTRPRQWAAPVAFAVTCVTAGALVFGLLHKPIDPDAPLPFPGERLRTQLHPPQFDLVDQEGAAVSLEALRGRVVLVTGIYARCGQTCPMILAQTKRAVATLTDAEREDLTVVAVTLDPEHDTPDRLGALAKGQGIAAPLYRLATGEVAEVNDVLDALGITRSRDPETGVISHANLFLVVDRNGKLAYRFTLGDRQEQWLGAALQALVREGGATTPQAGAPAVPPAG